MKVVSYKVYKAAKDSMVQAGGNFPTKEQAIAFANVLERHDPGSTAVYKITTEEIDFRKETK